ncbi:MAG: carboxypeptidase regulatory-like domain-containing protein [Acidobacteria bacterium]|nr:carboxypeptidase regulatory-like domain-containing protein [Acidobacteriota bacterium]MBI3473773.1 carboxypeptidase regulatory-like domain-containing protein [Candidatus Solibacter usitatus]
MKKFWISLGVAAALMLNGCGGGEKKEEKKAEAPAAAPAAAPVDDANAATVTGKVAFSGAKPTAKTISMEATPACARAHSTPQKSEEAVVNDNGTLRYTFVWVKAGLPDRQWPAASNTVALDQSGCMYRPHMLGVRAGQDIEVTNSDPTNHNIHPLPKVNREWNESQPPKGDKKIKQFAREEVMIPVKCNVHPWMKSYIGVVNHPFFAVTGEDGAFTLKGLPPGEYTIEAWHEKYGAMEQKVKVEAKESKAVDFEFKG